LGGSGSYADFLRCFETEECSYGFAQIVTQLAVLDIKLGLAPTSKDRIYAHMRWQTK